MRTEEEPTIDKLKEIQIEERGDMLVRVGVFPDDVRRVLYSPKIDVPDQIEADRERILKGQITMGD